MIIEKISIQNYLCYYGQNEFRLSEGLNIILGENGEGKTKLFEALEWLFSTSNEDLESLISARGLSEIRVTGDELKVEVAIAAKHRGGKQKVSKYFNVRGLGKGEIEIYNSGYRGVEDTPNGERFQRDGRELLEEMFPSTIRKYSMFKGEGELDIFDNKDALEILIDNFSQSTKYYGKYAGIGKTLHEHAEKAVNDSAKRDKKNSTRLGQLISEIGRLTDRINALKYEVTSDEEELEKLQEKIEDAGNYVENAQALEIINRRIKNVENEIDKRRALIEENYTELLFDKKWILQGFETIQKEYSDKVLNIDKEKRRLQTEFDKEKGKREIQEEILGGLIPLPITVPSRGIMEEMLNDEYCKVCNREAPKGSDPYNFMQQRLDNYLAKQTVSTEEDKTKELFVCDYTTRLITLNTIREDSLKDLRSVKMTIRDLFEFNKSRREEIFELEEKLEKEKNERNSILGKSKKGEESLSDVLRNYNAWQEDVKSRGKSLLANETELKGLEDQLEEMKIEKEGIDDNSASSFYVKTRNILRDIEKIFLDTKAEKFDEFITKLEQKSNEFFKRINVDSFTGKIHFEKRVSIVKTTVEVSLKERGGVFTRPNTSLLTSMHISILFAISELAKETEDETYPLIFDAPTSSFGENKTTQFLNMIYTTGNQKILLLKDYLVSQEGQELTVKEEFDQVKRNKAFWVRLERPFDREDLETINTEVITL